MCDCEKSHGKHECRGGCECCCEEGCGSSRSCQCGRHRFQRRYQTKAEQIAELEAYLSELKKEVQAVEEILADLQ